MLTTYWDSTRDIRDKYPVDLPFHVSRFVRAKSEKSLDHVHLRYVRTVPYVTQSGYIEILT